MEWEENNGLEHNITLKRSLGNNALSRRESLRGKGDSERTIGTGLLLQKLGTRESRC